MTFINNPNYIKAKAAKHATYAAYQAAEATYIAEETEALEAFDNIEDGTSHYTSIYECAKTFNNEAKAAKAAYEAADHYFQLVVKRGICSS